MQTRQVVLDTETTGLDPAAGHRVIEIGGVELVDRRLTGNHFHHYLNPDREIDAGAYEVHGISNDFLEDKPRFDAVADEFLDFIRGAELVIHNAPFDVGFLDHELQRTGAAERTSDCCRVFDTLMLARKRHPGQRNSLDALCKRYGIDNSRRDLHGALLDAEILADVYLAMTGGQVGLMLDDEPDAPSLVSAAPSGGSSAAGGSMTTQLQSRPRLTVIQATDAERAAHEHYLQRLDAASVNERCLWSKLEGTD